MNGTAYIVGDRAQALANYPHARKVGQFIYVSGVSSRRFDNTHAGVRIAEDGSVELDIREQTHAVIENIGVILQTAGATLANVVDVLVMLVDMNDYAGMNEVYNQFFQAETGPVRTTCAVHQLPHPNLLIEMKVVAWIGE